MGNDVKISIIIPVYNVEQYLEQCLDSVLQQTFKNYEIILVDDGSSDNSGVICDKFAFKYSFIHVIHKTNGGLSSARNAGLAVATGSYVLFVDSDDYIGKNAISQIISTVEQHDIDVVFLEAFKVFDNTDTVPMGDGIRADELNGKSKKDIMAYLSTLPKFPGSACAKLVRRELIDEHKLLFKENLLSEDIDWTIRLLLEANTFSYCNAKYYYYRQNRKGSITSIPSTKRLYSLLSIIKEWASLDMSRPYQIEINAFLAYEYMILLYLYGMLTPEHRKLMRQSVREFAWILKFSRNTKVRIVSILYKFCGVEITAMILSKYKELISR